MATLASTPVLSKHLEHSDELNHFEVLKQLERITNSPHFRNSKRYPNLLKFVVENTLSGHIELLKERTLGIEVFGRPPDYDTNSDPVVRVTAGEIRKRIAQYYQADGHEHELRIELPVGSYVPHFFLPDGIEPSPEEIDAAGATPTDGYSRLESGAGSVATEVAAAPSHLVRDAGDKKWLRPVLVALAFLLLGFVTASGFFVLRQRLSFQSEKGIDYFWKPIVSANAPALIVIGVHSLDSTGKDLSPVLHPSGSENPRNMLSSMIRYEMVPVTDIVSYSHLTRLLTRREHEYETQGSSDTTFEQLQRGPVILLGGFDNVWTLRLTSALRYRFESPGALVGVIADSQHPESRWSFDNGQSAVSDSRDYAIVASFFDPRIQQRMLIAAGIGKSGTAAAAEFLSNNKYLENWLAQAKPATGKNVEIVLSTEIVGGQQGPPQVIASEVW